MAFAEAKAFADKLGVLKDAMHQRGYMLRDMCQLYIANYYEEGSVKSTNHTDTASYQQQRKHTDALREQRERRGRDNA